MLAARLSPFVTLINKSAVFPRKLFCKWPPTFQTITKRICEKMYSILTKQASTLIWQSLLSCDRKTLRKVSNWRRHRAVRFSMCIDFPSSRPFPPQLEEEKTIENLLKRPCVQGQTHNVIRRILMIIERPIDEQVTVAVEWRI